MIIIVIITLCVVLSIQADSKLYFSHALLKGKPLLLDIIWEQSQSFCDTGWVLWVAEEKRTVIINRSPGWCKKFTPCLTLITEYQPIYVVCKLTSYISRMLKLNCFIELISLLYSFFVLFLLMSPFSFLVSFAETQDEPENCHQLLECNPCLWCKCSLCQTASPVHLHFP